jgi:molybdopterin-guanine dinucleotide biosynthesis protein A
MAGVVLCGGASVRMGRDKAFLEIGGRPLYAVLAESLASVADPVFLASGVTGRLGQTGGFQEISDVTPGRGPLAGIAAALLASPHPLTAVVAVDMPFASPAVLRLMASVHGGEDAVVPVTADGEQPLHAVYHRSARPALEHALAEGRLAVRHALRSLRVRRVTEEEWRSVAPDDRFALNLNRPEDLAALA